MGARPVALVTGASSGIGAALALRLALGEGYAVGLLARRADRLRAKKDEIEQEGGQAIAVPCDVGDPASVDASVAEVERALGPTRLLVANAGLSRPTDAFEPDLDDLEEELRVNLLGVVHAVRAVLPGMRERKSGHVVAVSSVAGWRGLPGAAGYCATKAALTTMIESLRVDWARHGIRSTTVHPGYVDTEIVAGADHPLPFLMSSDKAAGIIARAVRRKQARCDFPRRMVWLMRMARWVPDGVIRRVNDRARRQP